MEKIKFGEFLMREQKIKLHELIIALEKQKLFGNKIGENLVDCGYLKKSDLFLSLNLYKNENIFS